MRLAVIGAALVYFDPRQGPQAPCDGARQGSCRSSTKASSDARPATSSNSQASKEVDDLTLKAKVESEVFRPADAPKGDVDVNVENGVVYLRGQVEQPELIQDLELRVRAVQGVRDVENLLRAPGTEAPAG